MSDTKPLPSLPPAPPGTLSIEAQDHRARFIRYALKENPASASENSREAWADAIEQSLNDLCVRVAKEDWIAGIKERKTAQRLQQPRRSGSAHGSTSSESTHESQATDPLDSRKDAISQLRAKARQKATQKLHGQKKHVLLCLTPTAAQASVLREDSGFDIVPSNISCAFEAGSYEFHDVDDDESLSSVLYGLDNWEDSEDVHLVGGSFNFRGTTSPVQHHALAKILRICIYMSLSMLLEQNFLVDCGITLNFPRPMADRPPIAEPTPSSPLKPLSPFSPSGIFSFFSRRATAMARLPQISTRGASVDLGTRSATSQEPSSTARISLDSTAPTRIRRFSFLSSEPRPSVATTTANFESTFATTLDRLENSKGFLSTSPSVRISPPQLLHSLAAKEKDLAQPGQGLRLKAVEKLAMTTVLGWDSRTRGEGMLGMPGFVLQQEISVLSSTHVACQAPVPAEASGKDQDKGKGKEEESVVEKPTRGPPLKITPCGVAEWKTFRYFKDENLGDLVRRLTETADTSCPRKGCSAKLGHHIQKMTHGRASVLISMRVLDEKMEGDDMMLWTSCSECDHSSDKRKVSDGTYMLSFGKFLELLIYSDRLSNDSACPHSINRFLIRRHIRFKECTLSFSLERMEDVVFEIKPPRLQIIPGGSDRLRREFGADTEEDMTEGKRDLRRQIRTWWEGIAEFVDKLESTLVTSEGLTVPKHLPRLPSGDDDYDDLEDTPRPPASETPTASVLRDASRRQRNDYFNMPIANHPSGIPSTPSITLTSVTSEGSSTEEDTTATPTQSRLPSNPISAPEKPLPEPEVAPLERLASLRQTFHRTEQSLYSLLSRTPISTINDVRRAFHSSARGAEKRLAAWQRKHLPSLQDKIDAEEPEWFQKGCHVVPYGNIIVREGDWGSIIAFTMSTPDYTQEMVNMSVNRTASSSTATSPLPSSISPGSANSTFFPSGSSDTTSLGEGTVSSKASSSTAPSTGGYKLFRSSRNSQPDPDQDDVVWHEPEAYSAVISRKEHPRDPTGLMSIREVLRSKSPTADPISASRFGSVPGTNTMGRTMTPPSAWAKPEVQLSDVQVSKDGVEGKMTSATDLSQSGSIRMLHELDNNNSLTSRPGSSASSNSITFEGHIRRGKAASLVSISNSDASDTTAGPASGTVKERAQSTPSVQQKEKERPLSIASPSKREGSDGTAPTSSSFATFASGITQAMRLMLNHPDPSVRPSSPMSTKHGLLSTEAPIDDRPHIKYDWTIGKRLKFSCTVYYAKQFDHLRRRCGVDDVFLQSLSTSMNWAAEGGKSKSNFWMTADNRFIIKTLLNGWNVADLQVLIEIAPSYFRYMESTASRATVLAKLLGFYTVEIRNLESGNVQSKADLLVMENLFYERNIVKKFDLKGIQGRKVKPSSTDSNNRTFFDGDWIEGQQQTLTLVQPHSKAVLREAIRSDAEFLSRSNIMDYSLLVGLDEEHKHIACGLVDTIGSYTFAKTLEYKAKQGLNSGKEVTVIPPNEYQERFVNALDQYFVACPDKWSRGLDDRRTTGDPNDLPSVL